MASLIKYLLPCIFLGFSLSAFAQPEPPGSVTATSTTICDGESTTLSYTGGSGDTFRWYSGSCGETLEGEDNDLEVSPSVSTTYYGRWESGDEYSSCESVSITVDPLPTAPSSVTATQTTICDGSSTTLSYAGGSGTTFQWYAGSCGGTPVGTGNNLSVSPSVTTTFYGAWENSCGISACETVTINVNPLPAPPSSVTATPASICQGESSTLSFTGGTGITFNWYSGSCGGTLVGTGNNVVVSPTVTTTYYGAWENGCGISACASVTVSISPTASAPSSVSASQTSICSGDPSTLSYTGGSGATFHWYSGSCGGTSVGIGNDLQVFPNVTTTYFGRWETNCGNSDCLPVTINVSPSASPPASVTATPSSICQGESTSLSFTGGSGTTFNWYTGSCGGTLVGTGNNLVVSPSVTTTYYGAWENNCGMSGCLSVTVPISPAASPPSSVSASQTSICSGDPSTLSYTGGSGATFYWYTGSCGETFVGIGNNLQVFPAVTTTYYGRWETNCGSSDCLPVTINVNPSADPPASVSATLTTICEGASSTLSYTGGAGTTFRWYSGSCEGTLVGTGNNLTVTPSVTTTYFGQWESSCGNSGCLPVTINVIYEPTAPSSVSASETVICENDPVILSYTGGSGEYFRWYTGSCGGTLAGPGNDLSVAPTVTTTYYGRWESSCGISECLSVTVTVNYFPVPPISIAATETTICEGESVILSNVGGEGDTFNWFDDACRGTLIATGTSLEVSPIETTTYFGQWENMCGAGICEFVTIDVNHEPVAPTDVTASQTTLCQGQSTTLSFTGGEGDIFRWFSGGCGETQIGTGDVWTVYPTVTTTYYGRWETPCGLSECDSVTVIVEPFVTSPSYITASPAGLCDGGTSTLSYFGGEGNIFNWYTGYCGGTLVGNGNDLSVSPSETTTYYGRWENSCFNSDCEQITIEVSSAPTAPDSVSASPDTVCQGRSTTLRFYGGSGSSFRWFADSCNGTPVGIINNLTVYPTETTTYFGRWESSCGISECDTLVVTVEPYVTAPVSVSASRTDILLGDSITLSYSGGGGGTFNWYSGSCDGSYVGSGNNLRIAPEITQDYYGRWENSCFSSDCEYVSVKVTFPSGVTVHDMGNLMIYPNPSSEILYVKSPTSSFRNVELSLIDNTGKVIYETSYELFGSNLEYAVDLSDLSSGIYFLRIRNQDMVMYEKVIKR